MSIASTFQAMSDERYWKLPPKETLQDPIFEYVAQVVDIWKTKINLAWVPQSNHMKRHVCFYTQLIDEVSQSREKDELPNSFLKDKIKRNQQTKYHKQISFNGCNMENVQFCVFGNGPMKHICIKNYCHQKHGERPIFRFEHLYICTTYAEPHICSKYCKMRQLNREHMYVCPLTGLSNGDVEITMVNANFQLYGTIDQVHRNENNTTGNQISMEDLNLQSSRKEITIEKQNSTKKTADQLSGYLERARARIWNMLSEERFQRELERSEPDYYNINYQIERYINKTIQNIKTEGNGCFDVLEMCIIANEHIRKKQEFPLVSLTTDMTKKLTAEFADMCIKLWVIIRTMTTMGRDKPNFFIWPEFIDVAMYIFQQGFIIPKNNKNSYDIILFEPNQFLASIPLDIMDRCDSANIAHREPKIKYAKTMKKNIYQALSKAIKEEKISPELLKLENVSLEAVDREIFMNNGLGAKNPKKKSSKRKKEIIYKVEKKKSKK